MAIDKTIQRPLMGPNFTPDEVPTPSDAPSRVRALRIIWRLAWRLVKTCWRVLTYDPLRKRLRIEDGNLLTRTVRGLGYRLAFVPIMLAGIVCLMVWSATHQHTAVVEKDFNAAQLYFDRVSFMTRDNVQLEGVLFPVIDAKQIVAEQEKALRKRYPAVVLVHDFALRKDQMLPLVRPLHDAGFVVLAMNLRGNGTSGAGAAQTFGLREADDVSAAIEMLRRRPFVDATRITVVGAGTGATAALISAKRDGGIAAMVVADPIKSVDTLLDGRLAPRHPWLVWLRPMCKWTFEMSFQLDLDDVAWSEFDRLRQSLPTLVMGTEGGNTDFSRPMHVEEIRRFLVRQVVEPKLPTVKAD